MVRWHESSLNVSRGLYIILLMNGYFRCRLDFRQEKKLFLPTLCVEIGSAFHAEFYLKNTTYTSAIKATESDAEDSPLSITDVKESGAIPPLHSASSLISA
jgi:hypothetical protein